MEADYEELEVVFALGGYELVDGESYQRRYWNPGGPPLEKGYYVVRWPTEIRIRRFDQHARFHGPFLKRPDAEAYLRQVFTGFASDLAVSSVQSPEAADANVPIVITAVSSDRRPEPKVGAGAKPFSQFPSPGRIENIRRMRALSVL